MAAIVDAYPGRLYRIASVDPTRPMDAVHELRRCVRDLGAGGVRVAPWLWELPPDDWRHYPIYAECRALGVPFCLQVGHTDPLRPPDPGRPIPDLDHFALEFPDLRIVGGHTGSPWTSEIISLCLKFPDVHVDTSAYGANRYPADLLASLIAARSITGPARPAMDLVESPPLQPGLEHSPRNVSCCRAACPA